MSIEIKISGSGNPQEVAAALRQVADDIIQGGYIDSINKKGSCIWEDPYLLTEILEEIV